MKYELRSTKTFNDWFSKLKDKTVKNKLLSRLDRINNGNFGDHKQLTADLFELRFFFGAGVRIYYTLKNNKIVLLLAGGDKSTQSKDIEKAKEILKELKE